MKLRLTHILLVFLVIVIFCSLYKPTLEGMDSYNKRNNNNGYYNDNDGYNNNNNGYNNNNYYDSDSDSDSDNESDDDTNNNFNDNYMDGNDQYILKSKIVPPVCPKCPDQATCPRQKPCPACPPCARCPEPAFTCKKVPDYTSTNQSQLPFPMLNTFSAFR